MQDVCSSFTALNLRCCWQVVDALNQSVRVANRIEVVDAAVGTIMAMATALGGDAFDNLADKVIDSILMKSGASSAWFVDASGRPDNVCARRTQASRIRGPRSI